MITHERNPKTEHSVQRDSSFIEVFIIFPACQLCLLEYMHMYMEMEWVIAIIQIRRILFTLMRVSCIEYGMPIDCMSPADVPFDCDASCSTFYFASLIAVLFQKDSLLHLKNKTKQNWTERFKRPLSTQ